MVQNMTYLRNIAAHQGRLWNRKFDGYVALPDIALRVKRDYVNPKTPAAMIALIAGLVDQILKSNQYSTRLLDRIHSTEDFLSGYYYPRA
ncbi:Abi family protein [Arcanobacterium haemolyticum]|nr:hypothetical protein [Arcanobacterium haemolyticum]SQH27391.1 Abortive infection bacteriophage resistance protein [Arcanobacterium haemolyticum]